MIEEDLGEILSDWVERAQGKYRIKPGEARELLSDFARALKIADDPTRTGKVARCYAEVMQFRISCPKCARLIWVGAPPSVLGAFGKDQKGYDKATQVLRCIRCKKAWVVGLVLWPAKGDLRLGATKPKDASLSYREMLELRDRGRGLVTEQDRTLGEAVNLNYEGEDDGEG